jgi:hypothetical protein
MEVSVATTFHISLEKGKDLLMRPEVLCYVAEPLIIFKPLLPATWPERWVSGSAYEVTMYLLGCIPLGKQIIRIAVVKDTRNTFSLLDDGSGALIRRWRHLITITFQAPQIINYRDEVAIQAGLATPLVALFAKLFYTWRQYRWKKLIAQKYDPVVKK